MEAIQNLVDEHRLILRSLSVAQIMAKRFYEEHKIQKDDLLSWVDFVVNYADTFHHKKEEDVLFVWMKERGFPSGGGPITCMLQEHDIGRSFIKTIKEVVHLGEFTNKKNIETVCAALIDFASHLSNHIYKEDNILYPMAEQLAQKGDDAELLKRYAEKISTEDSRQIQDKNQQLVAHLESRYC